MIGLEVTGKIPQLPEDPMLGIMEKIATRMEDSVLMNFMMSGRPDQWEPLKSGGETPLVATGGLMRSVRSEFDDKSATVSAKDTIHQKGGHIREIKSSEGKLMVFMYDGQLIFTRSRKAFDIPARPYMLFQESDIDFIYELIPNAIISGLTYESITTH